MRVKSCEASDNQNRPIELSDNDGCVLRPKMVSKFMKMRSTDPRATVVTYAFFHAFKFPDSMAVHIRYVTISPWNSHSCRLNLKPLKKPSGIKIRVSKNLNYYSNWDHCSNFCPLPILHFWLVVFGGWENGFLLLKISFYSPHANYIIYNYINKTYFDISNGQKFEL